MLFRHLFLTCTLPALSLAVAQAQGPTWTGTPAAGYEDRFRELWKVGSDASRAADVKHLMLRRDGATITLEEGRISLLKPIGGQVMGAIFRGKGHLSYRPATRIEQDRLTLFRKDATFEEPFDDLVLLFADSTLDELTRALTFRPGAPPRDLEGRVDELLDYLGDEGDYSLDPDLLRPFLNGEASGLFLAMIVNGSNDPWVFELNPSEVEGVQLLTRAKHTGGNRRMEPVTMNRPQGSPAAAPTGYYAERNPDVHVAKYVMEIRLPQTGTGELAFSADATLDLVADAAAGPWVPFYIFDKMRVDSARWADGTPVQAYIPKDSPYLWVRCDRRLEQGDTRSLHLSYHGDLIDRFGDWFFIKSSITWYPLAMEARYPALFDLTFTSPEGFLLAAVGERRDSTGAPGHMVRTRWTTTTPIRNASFNLGLFQQYDIRSDSAPSVTLLWSEDMQKALATIGRRMGGSPALLRGKNMKEQVGQDVSSAIQFYSHVYGAPSFKRFYATEIPDFHGEAWPGIIGLSWVTFQQTNDEGFDEVFRAHEVGHQWWGIGVDFATYHDRWMSEGFSDFSGLWYLQTRRQSNDKYFDLLRRWKADILLRRDDPIPIWLGHRVATSNTGDDYSAIIYQKGAYVVHMLRILLLDLKTMSETRFTETMRDFYQTYAGRRASTEDFRRVVEQHTGQDMGWFFDQWVYGSGIPTYKVAWKAEQAGNAWQVKLRVDQERVAPEFLAYVPVTVDLGDNRFARLRVKVTGARSEIDLPPLPAKPKEVKVNDFEGVLAEVKQVTW